MMTVDQLQRSRNKPSTAKLFSVSAIFLNENIVNISICFNFLEDRRHRRPSSKTPAGGIVALVQLENASVSFLLP